MVRHIMPAILDTLARSLRIVTVITVAIPVAAQQQGEPPRTPAFAVLSGEIDTASMQVLTAILGGGDKQLPVVEVRSVRDAIGSKADVLIFPANHPIESQMGFHDLEDLKECKVIGIGRGAARLFGKMGLEITSGACASSRDLQPSITVENSELLGESWSGKSPIVAFELPSEEGEYDFNFAMYIPRKSHLCSVVDVIARWDGDENYAPIVRQGNCVMIGLAAPASTWTPAYRQLFRELAYALRDRKVEPFATAKWDVTKPGTYNFKLAKGRSTTELSGKTFYFKFAEPTTFTAHLEHEGSNSIMFHFMGERDYEHITRMDAHEGEPLEISIDITDGDLWNIGDRYWRLRVVNFDKEHTADCTLRIEYSE